MPCRSGFSTNAHRGGGDWYSTALALRALAPILRRCRLASLFAQLVKRGRVDPPVPLSRVIALAAFELLEKANHAGAAQVAAKHFHAFSTDFIQGRRHR